MKRAQPEMQIHKAIMSFLDSALPSTVRAFHPANGGRRDAKTGAMLKALGVKAGVADIVLVRQGGVMAFIEVKAGKGSSSPAQKEWQDWCGENGVPYAVVRSIGDVQAVLTDWNIELRGQVAA